MTRLARLLMLICFRLTTCGVCATAQSAPDYDALVQQGKTQLQAGNNDAALASANAAIKLDASRWEAYALSAGALINLRQCDAARRSVSVAIANAPEQKKSALDALVSTCAYGDRAAPGPSLHSSGPSLSETTDWLTRIMQAYGGDRGVPSKITSFRIDSACTLHWTEHKTSSDASDRKWFQDEDVSVPLGAITKLQTEFLSGTQLDSAVNIETGNINAVQWVESGYHSKATTGASNTYDIPVQRHPSPQQGEPVPESPQQMLPRIVNALQHAISLCQGTYKQPTRTNEPF